MDCTYKDNPKLGKEVFEHEICTRPSLLLLATYISGEWKIMKEEFELKGEEGHIFRLQESGLDKALTTPSSAPPLTFQRNNICRYII